MSLPLTNAELDEIVFRLRDIHDGPHEEAAAATRELAREVVAALLARQGPDVSAGTGIDAALRQAVLARLACFGRQDLLESGYELFALTGLYAKPRWTE